MAELRSSDLPRAPGASDPAAVHPPGYYAVLAVLYSVFNLDAQTPSGAILSLRLMSLLLLLPIPWLCAATATALRLEPRAVVASAFLPGAWIQFVHIGSVVNNGTLTTTSVAFVTALLVPVVRSRELSGLRAVAVGLGTTVGLLAKGFALGLPVMVLAAYISAMRPDTRRPVLRALALALAASIPGLMWWLVKLNANGFPDPPTWRPGTTSSNSPIEILSGYTPRAFLDLSGSLWANLGWLNTPLPNALHLFLTGTALILLAVGTWRWRQEVWLLVILHASWVIPLVLIIGWSFRFYLSHGFVDGMQGRYIFCGVVPFSTLAVAALEGWSLLVRHIPLLAFVAALAGMVFGLRAFWDPADPRIVLGWWPGGAAVATAALVLVALAVVVTMRNRRRTPEPL